MSLRARVIAAMAVVAVVLTAVAVVLVGTTRRELIAQVDDRLVAALPEPSSIDRLASGVPIDVDVDDDDDRDGRPLDRGRGGRGGRERKSDLYEGIVIDGELLTIFVPNVGDDYGPPDVGDLDLRSGERDTFFAESDGGDVDYRVLAQGFPNATVVVAAPVEEVQETIRQLVWTVILGALIILVSLGLVTWWVVRLGIRPVNEMARAATQIADGDLDARVPETSPATESGRLSIALNRMLGTIVGALDERARSEERLRQFVADASHELRTPVTTIRGYAELYRHGGLSDAGALDDAMRRTEQEAARMGRLVEDMLTLAKLDEARPLDRRPLDLADLVRDAAADVAVVAPERDLSVVVADGSFVVDGDEDRLRQVLANVVGNALVHTDADVPIELRLERGAAGPMIEVADHGAGMAPETAARITERFYRADASRSRARGGSGLGLAIVDAAVSAHGGSVEVDSRLGRGTTVRISLPDGQRSAAGDDAPRANEWAPPAATDVVDRVGDGATGAGGPHPGAPGETST